MAEKTQTQTKTGTKPEQDDWTVGKLVGIAVVTLFVVFNVLYNISPHTPKMVFDPDPEGHIHLPSTKTK